ncbi:hypothetical protein JA1_004705 [Spathaspora sp. JA1]|nr:hypothetical protein JA1_004705 [Spathaspora sp. JA1]
MTSDQETDDSLPPFSFSKRPVDCPKNRISSLSFTESSIISTEPKEKITKKKLSPVPPTDMDYNDQIRFPRMGTTYYTKQNSLEFAPTISSYYDKESSNETIIEDSKDNYKPATFDLTKPLRRLSMPSKPEHPVGNDDSVDGLLLEQYTTNNYIYERKMNQDRLREIINDKSSSPTPKESRLRNQSSIPKLKEFCPKSLHQVYELKKPLLTPAVLRPFYTNDESSQAQDQLVVSQSQIEVVAHPIKTVYTIIAPELPVELDIEPIHSHWKLNGITKSCMSCFKPFGRMLLSLIYDAANKRHHCRFCGLIFCIDCLVQDNEPVYSHQVTLLDSQAQFVIPIFKNLNQIPSQEYKCFKVCKKCNSEYNFLVEDINKSLEGGEWKYLSTSARDELKKLPFVCVENPYVGMTKTTRFRVNTDTSDREERFGRKISGIGDVPNDWTWSSF